MHLSSNKMSARLNMSGQKFKSMVGFALRNCRKTSTVRFSLYFSHSVFGFDGPQVVNIMAKSPAYNMQLLN
jgi:hypothetical protein